MSGKPKRPSTPEDAAAELRELIRQAHEAAQGIQQSLKDADQYVKDNAVPELHKQLVNVSNMYAKPFRDGIDEFMVDLTVKYREILDIVANFRQEGYTLRLISNDLVPVFDKLTVEWGGNVIKGLEL